MVIVITPKKKKEKYVLFLIKKEFCDSVKHSLLGPYKCFVEPLLGPQGNFSYAITRPLWDKVSLSLLPWNDLNGVGHKGYMYINFRSTYF